MLLTELYKKPVYLALAPDKWHILQSTSCQTPLGRKPRQTDWHPKRRSPVPGNHPAEKEILCLSQIESHRMEDSQVQASTHSKQFVEQLPYAYPQS